MEVEAPDIRVWQDRPEIEGGVGWWRQIEDALERVEFLVIVMTPGVLASEVTRKEWRAARQSGVCVFPVKGPGFAFDSPRLPVDEPRTHLRSGCAVGDIRRASAPRVPDNASAVHGTAAAGRFRRSPARV